MSLDNANATEGEKKAASKIGAAFIGKKVRSEMHADIMKNGTQEEKDKLLHLEKTRLDKRRKRSKSQKRRMRKKKTRPPNETPEERLARKQRQLKRRETRKAERKKTIEQKKAMAAAKKE
jgi:hypothetical protein